jgi:hypothetical protein
MARARLLKPGFFKNEDLARLSPLHRLCYAGLWTLADREGRLEDRPGRIQAELFPYDRKITEREVHRMLHVLAQRTFVVRYGDRNGHRYLSIPTFLNHQTPHHREPASRIPAPPTRNRNGKFSAAAKPAAKPGLAQGQPDPSRAVYGDPVPVQVPPVVPLKGGRAEKGKRRRRRGDVAGGSRCPHDPACPSSKACIERTLAEARATREA